MFACQIVLCTTIGKMDYVCDNLKQACSKIVVLKLFSNIVVGAVIVTPQSCVWNNSITDIFFSLQQVICMDFMLLRIGNEF